MQNPLVFAFEDLDSDKAEQSLSRYFQGAGEHLVQATVDPRVRRTSGVSFKQIELVFADGQRLTLLVKQSGDIYQVMLNGKAFAIHAQHDQEAAIAEMVKGMDASRTKFQAALAKTRAVLPARIKTSTPNMRAAMEQQLADLNDAIVLAHEELSIA